MKRFILTSMMLVIVSECPVNKLRADVKSKAAMEVAEYVVQRFGRKAVQEGTEVFARKIETAAARHGSDVFMAVRKVGPKALPLLEQAGAHGGKAAQVLAKHGEAGAVWVVSRPAALNLVVLHGEGAASALVKHAGGIGEEVIGRFGSPAVRALEAAGPQSGRRLAMMVTDGQLAKIGRAEELLEVIAKYGDRGAAFIWEHKGVLVSGALLAAFIANPEPYLDGTMELVKATGEAVIKPVMDSTVKPAIGGIFNTVYLAVGLLGLVVAGGVILALKYGLPRAEILQSLCTRLKK